MSTFQIVRATCGTDIERIAPLFDSYRVFYGRPPDLERSHAFLLERWTANESVLFLADDGAGNALGFVQLYPAFLSDKLLRFWILNDLFVVAHARRAGIARELVRRSERHARETRSGGLTLSTAVDNVNAQALYESEGYVRDADFLYYNRFLQSQS